MKFKEELDIGLHKTELNTQHEANYNKKHNKDKKYKNRHHC